MGYLIKVVEERKAERRLLTTGELANGMAVSSAGNDQWIKALFRMEQTLVEIDSSERQTAAGTLQKVNLGPQTPIHFSPSLAKAFQTIEIAA